LLIDVRLAIGDWLTALIAAATLAAWFRWKIGTPAVMAIAAIIGLIGFHFMVPTWVFVK